MTNLLNYKIYGTGQAIIILHGLFGMLDNWKSIARKLQEEYQVILVDQRNHGRSMRSDTFSYEVMAKDVITLMDFLGLEKVIILGHSMGGKTAIQTAYSYSNRIQKLIVVDIVPKTYRRGHDEIFKAINNVPINSITNRKEAEGYLGPYIDNLGVRQFLLKNLHRNTDGSFEWKANFNVLHREYDKMVAGLQLDETIDTPSLFIRGTRSNYISDEDIVILNELFGNAQTKDIEASHWVHAERPDELLGVLRTFLTS
ncbi:MAG: esterase [Saprospiraceae bacterium]|jgi:esterase